MTKVTLTIPDEQSQYSIEQDLKLSWILQDALTKRMEGDIKTSADILRKHGYLSSNQYKKIIDDFEKHVGDLHDELTDHELKRERRKKYDIWRKGIQVNKKIKEEIDWIDVQLGKKKPRKEDSYKFTYKDKL